MDHNYYNELVDKCNIYNELINLETTILDKYSNVIRVENEDIYYVPPQVQSILNKLKTKMYNIELKLKLLN